MQSVEGAGEEDAGAAEVEEAAVVVEAMEVETTWRLLRGTAVAARQMRQVATTVVMVWSLTTLSLCVGEAVARRSVRGEIGTGNVAAVGIGRGDGTVTATAIVTVTGAVTATETVIERETAGIDDDPTTHDQMDTLFMTSLYYC